MTSHVRALLVAAAVAASAAAGCGTSSTRITATPVDARVYVNGERVCATTPCYWTDTIGLPHRAHLQIRRAGYKEVNLYVDKEIKVWMRVAAFIVRYAYGAGYFIEPFTYTFPKDM